MGLGYIYTALSWVLNSLLDLLPSSDAKSGPLSQLSARGESIALTIAKGIASSGGVLFGALKKIASEIDWKGFFIGLLAGVVTHFQRMGFVALVLGALWTAMGVVTLNPALALVGILTAAIGFAVSTAAGIIVDLLLGGVSDGLRSFGFIEYGKQIVVSLAKGVGMGLGYIYTALSWVLNSLLDLLPSSDAKSGPLSNLSSRGESIVTVIAKGVASSGGALFNALKKIASEIDWKGFFVAVLAGVVTYFQRMGFIALVIGALWTALGVVTLNPGLAIVGLLTAGIGFAVSTAAGAIVDMLLGEVNDGIGSIGFIEYGKNVVISLAKGVGMGLGYIYTALSWVLNSLLDLLPSSDAKSGPLSELSSRGESIVKTIAKGVSGAGGFLFSALKNIASSIDWKGFFVGLLAGVVTYFQRMGFVTLVLGALWAAMGVVTLNPGLAIVGLLTAGIGFAVSTAAGIIVDLLLGGVSEGFRSDGFIEYGKQIVVQLAKGVGMGLGYIVTAISWVLNSILDLLPSSDAKSGPLSNLTARGESIVSTIAKGVASSGPALFNALKKIASNIDWKGFFVGLLAGVVTYFQRMGFVTLVLGALWTAMGVVTLNPGLAIVGLLTAGIGFAVSTASGIIVDLLLGGVSDGLRSVGFIEYGKNIVVNLAKGVGMGLGYIYTALSWVLNSLLDLLPSSDAKKGPLSNLSSRGESIVKTIAKGVEGAGGFLFSALKNIASSIDWKGFFVGLLAGVVRYFARMGFVAMVLGAIWTALGAVTLNPALALVGLLTVGIGYAVNIVASEIVDLLLGSVSAHVAEAPFIGFGVQIIEALGRGVLSAGNTCSVLWRLSSNRYWIYCRFLTPRLDRSLILLHAALPL